MNINKYLCNLNHSYLALIMTSTINHIIKDAPPIKETGIFYTEFWVDTDKGIGMAKSVHINTGLRTKTKLFEFTDIDVYITGAFLNPIVSGYKYNEIKHILEIIYQVML